MTVIRAGPLKKSYRLAPDVIPGREHNLRRAAMRFLVHGVLGLSLVLATTGVASATKCTDHAAVATARGTADARCAGEGRGCANASNHGHYVSCVAQKATDLVDSGDLPKECKGEV